MPQNFKQHIFHKNEQAKSPKKKGTKDKPEMMRRKQRAKLKNLAILNQNYSQVNFNDILLYKVQETIYSVFLQHVDK